MVRILRADIVGVSQGRKNQNCRNGLCGEPLLQSWHKTPTNFSNKKSPPPLEPF